MIAFRYVAFVETLFLLSLCESGPFFTIEPLPKEVNIGGTVEFECAAGGLPTPRIVWYRDSQRVIPRPSGPIRELAISVDGLNNHKKLIITGVRYEEHGGDYACEAENKAGVIRSRKAKLIAPYFLKDKDYFTRNPQTNYTRMPGQGTIIHCQFDSNASWPPAQIFWRKENSNEKDRFDSIGPTETRFISRLNGTMVIAQTKPEDSGTYRCGARNVKMGYIQESDNTKLIVESGQMRRRKAEIYVPQERIAIVVRATAILECIPYGTPPPYTIKWSKEGGELPVRSEMSDNTVVLSIPNFGEDAVGRYYCSLVQDGEMKRQSIIDLTLLEPPEFRIPNQNLTVMEGDNLTIPCDCLGAPRPHVTWFKNTESIRNSVNQDDSLTLRNVKAITSGMYQCHCTNNIGNAQATFAVKVKGPAKIVSEASDKSVRQGTEVTLTCEAQGSPTPSIVWLKDGRALPSDSRIRHHENLYESTIYISDVRITDNGVYECKAINENGDDSMFIKISVRGEPFINVKPKDTVGITGSDIVVPCEATAEPVPTITWYRNERSLSRADITKYEITDSGLLIKNAQAVDGGSFMCQAKNSEGTRSSSPVQVTVYDVPNITHALQKETNVTAGKTGLLLPCGITKDYAQYQWYRRGIPLLNVYYGDNVSPRIETRKGFGLYFHTVLPEDQGIYSCNVSNPAAKAGVAGYLYVDVMPTVTFITPSLDVREYQNFWLDCLYEGEPKPDLTWTHNNNQIRRDHTIFSNGTLRITQATRFDSGQYQCTVTNRQGSKSKGVVIQVRSKARIENVPSLQYPITGRRSTIICEVSGFPFPRVEWWKNGQRIQDQFNNEGYTRAGTNLVVEDPSNVRHNGLYTCKASNDYGSDTQITKVEVLDMPVVTRVTGCGAVKSNMECKLTCEATGNPLPEVTWRIKYEDQTEIVSSDNNRFYVSSIDTDNPPLREISLTIKDLKESDSMTYYCHAENLAGTTTKSYPLRVRYQAIIDSPPLPTYEVPIGATLTITCGARGEPKPDISWRKEKGSLQPNGRSKVNEDGSLVIMNLQPEDEGDYSCIADNDSNSLEFDPVSISTTVKVTSKDAPLTVIDNPIETWLIVVIVICVFVVCIVVFVSVKMIRDRSRERRSYKPTQMTKPPEDQPTYNYETVTPKPVMFQVPIDTSNSLPMYNLRTLNWADPKHPPNTFQSQFDDVDRQLQGLLKDLDNPKVDNLESDI